MTSNEIGLKQLQNCSNLDTALEQARLQRIPPYSIFKYASSGSAKRAPTLGNKKPSAWLGVVSSP